MRAIKVPADPNQRIEVVTAGPDFHALARIIGRGCEYIEEVKCTLTPEYGYVMVVDEDGLAHDQPHNKRAQFLYPFSRIVGDVLVCNTGWVDDGRDFVDFEDTDHALVIVQEMTA